MAVATCVAPLKIFTMLLDNAVPVNVGRVLLVIRSLLNGPLSLATARLIVGVCGGVLFAANEPLGPNAATLLPAMSLAVPAASDMLRLPVPVMLLITTVRTVALFVTMLTTPLAVPVLFKVTLPAAKVMVFNPDPPPLSEYVNVLLTGPVAVLPVLGPLTSTVGAI